MKVAIVHEWFESYVGSERVVEQLLRLFPQADLYCLCDFIKGEDRAFFQGKKAHTTFIQKLPMAERKFRAYLPLMPFAIEQFDLSGYDVVISSSHAFAKGCHTNVNQLHLCYCYTPMRYAWDFYHEYLSSGRLTRGLKGIAARGVFHYLRMWDTLSSFRIDHFAACSSYIARRIRKYYRREAQVIYPPVDTARFPLHEKKEDFYLVLSRMVPYKKVDLIVDAFTAMPDRKLVVVGDGPDYDRIRKSAGKNIEFMGFAAADTARELLQKAKCLVFAADEDFGITPVEAMACGTPVLAYRRGGACETVKEGVSGLFFPDQQVKSLCDAVKRFDEMSSTFDPAAVRAQAELFGIERFQSEFMSFFNEKVQSHGATVC
jgi:glycosyltransferase involved in cell wall biosynthesis